MATVPKVGVFVPQGWKQDLADIPDPIDQYEAMTRVGQEAERLGFDSIWLYDHFHTIPQPTLQTTFECWTATAGLARDTKTIRIGQMVTCNGYRNPALLAKIASTVDVMSHGRLDFGIGAGWYEHEYKAFGYPYPDGPERLRMLRDALQIIHAMWTEDYATFEGKYHQVRGAINEPKGVQQPHIPIWIGGSGEKVTLKLVAQYGDACNISGTNPDNYRHKFAVLREHCDAVGRDYDSIIKSANMQNIFLLEPGEVAQADALTEPYRFGQPLAEWRKTNFVGTAQELLEVCGRIMETGADYLIMYVMEASKLTRLQHLASEVLPALRG
jgi:F420-dependent oxidoreductase-like protein